MDVKKVARKARMIQFRLNFWTKIARLTRFGMHGFILWRIRRAYEDAAAYNRMAVQFNRQQRRERRRERAIRRNVGAR